MPGAEEEVALLLQEMDDGHAAGVPEGQLQGLRQPSLHAVFQDQAIDDDLDRVLFILVERDRLAQLPDPAVHPRPDEPQPLHLLELFAVLPLPPADDGRHNEQARSGGKVPHGVHHLLDGLGGDRLPAGGTVRPADPGEQQAEVVMDLRHCPDGGAGVVAGRLLLDGDGGGEPLDRLHVGLVHLLQELAGIGRQRLDVAPLPLGVDRVEGERRLPRAREPRDDDEPVAGDHQVESLEVVLPRPADGDLIFHAGPLRIEEILIIPCCDRDTTGFSPVRASTEMCGE
jgi:hypothetical protein